jgi:uncharacterized protein (DUF2252 family)
MNEAVAAVLKFNRRRIPPLRREKLESMSRSAFRFFRGACHLFYEQWKEVREGPRVQICGDLHLENFGSFRNAARDMVYDINDFDESTAAPATWDVARCAVSIFLAARELKKKHPEAPEGRVLARHYLETYGESLRLFAEWGAVGLVDAATAPAPIAKILTPARETPRTRAEFLDAHAHLVNGSRRFVTGALGEKHLKYLAVPDARAQTRRSISAALRRYHSPVTRSNPAFFEVLDVAFRFAGIGSLGLEQYAVLLEGYGAPDGNVILLLKEVPPRPATERFESQPHKKGDTRAMRVVLAQRLMQAVPPAFLGWVTLSLGPWGEFELGRRSKRFLVREIGPTGERLELDKLLAEPMAMSEVVATAARCTAWAHARSAGVGRWARPRELGAFGADRRLRTRLLDAAEAYVTQVRSDRKALAAYLEKRGARDEN